LGTQEGIAMNTPNSGRNTTTLEIAEYQRAKEIQRGSMMWRVRLMNAAWFGFGAAIWLTYFLHLILHKAAWLSEFVRTGITRPLATLWNSLLGPLAWRWTIGFGFTARHAHLPPDARPLAIALEAFSVVALVGIAAYVGRWIYFDAQVRAMDKNRPSDFAIKAVAGALAWIAVFALLEKAAGPIYAYLDYIPTR